MIKQKLIEKRKAKGKSQEDMAFAMKISQSQYSRRESGTIEITHEEWEEMAQILNVPMEEIYQKEESMVFICKDNANGNYQGNNNIYTVPEFLLDNQQKYIAKLEEENTTLKTENTSLKEEIAFLREQVGGK